MKDTNMMQGVNLKEKINTRGTWPKYNSIQGIIMYMEASKGLMWVILNKAYYMNLHFNVNTTKGPQATHFSD